MASSKKNSPDYLKSRMGTFLSPLFLTSIVVLGVIGIIAWQLIAINNQFRQNSTTTQPPSRSGASIDVDLDDVVENDETTDNPIDPDNPETSPLSEGNPTTEDPLDLEIRDIDLLASDDAVESRNAPNSPQRAGLYNQVLSLPRISPQITPSANGDNNGFVTNQGLLSPDLNQQRQYNSQIPIAPSPLNQAVNNVMTNYNPNRNISPSQTPTTSNNVPSGGQQYYSPPIQTTNMPSGVNSTVNPWVPTPTPQGINQNQRGTIPPIGQVSRTNESPF